MASTLSLNIPNLTAAQVTELNTLESDSGLALTVAAGKSPAINNSITFAGTDGTTITLQGTDTYVGRATTDTLTNKTLTSPTLTTPVLGAATATTINKVTLTAPATGSTLTIADGKTATVNNTLTLAGTDATTLTFQGTDTYVGRTTTDTLTNKTLTSPVMTGASTNTLSVSNNVTTTAPNTQTGSTYSVVATDNFIVINASGTCTLTLGTATAGRDLIVKTIANQTVVSASSNVIPLAGGSAGTAILAGTAGKYARIVGDGTNWNIMSAN